MEMCTMYWVFRSGFKKRIKLVRKIAVVAWLNTLHCLFPLPFLQTYYNFLLPVSNRANTIVFIYLKFEYVKTN